MHTLSFSSLFSKGENNSFESNRQLGCLEGRIGFHQEWRCYNGLIMQTQESWALFNTSYHRYLCPCKACSVIHGICCAVWIGRENSDSELS